jgi:UDPglucose 6-dehydrogenase
VRSASAAARGADAIVIATDWPEFAQLDLARLRAAARGDLLIDGRHMIEPQAARDAGFDYYAVGSR